MEAGRMNRRVLALAFAGMFCLLASTQAGAQKAAPPRAEAILDSLYKKTAGL
jgi:outer membrane lipoprotein-sorting protein